jgi:NADPH:quinone reductase-like Zn-dependent oxidoreductase
LEGVVPVSDGSGVVLDVGSSVTGLQRGDKVTTALSAWQSGPPEQRFIDRLLGNALNGVLQEYAVIPEHYLVPLPRTLSFIEGSTLPVAGLTAWNALFGAQGRPLLPGQWVVTQGTGGVSTFVIIVSLGSDAKRLEIRAEPSSQFAKAVGANVIATTSTTAKCEKLRELGADHVLNYTEMPEWGESAKRLTPGAQGADVVVEIGGGVSLKQV